MFAILLGMLQLAVLSNAACDTGYYELVRGTDGSAICYACPPTAEKCSFFLTVSEYLKTITVYTSGSNDGMPVC